MYFHGILPKYFEGETSRTSTGKNQEDPIQLDFPTRIPDFPYSEGPIQSFACGEDHALAVINSQLYGFGSNKVFQLHNKLNGGECKGVNSFVPLPQIPGAESPVAQVACGIKHSIVRLVDGSLFACGYNSYSQLGFKGRGSNDPFSQWRRVALDEPVTKIFAAGHQSFALSSGRVFSWGRQEYGSLGHGTRGEMERTKSNCADQFKDVDTPKLIQWFVHQRITVVDLCPARTHTVAMSATDVYTWGEGAYHKLGHGTSADELFPRRVMFPQTNNLEKLETISASEDATIILKTSQLLGAVIYIVGKDGGSDNEWNSPQRLVLPFKVERPRELISGPGHFFLTTVDGEVFCYGKNTSVPSLSLGLTGKDRDRQSSSSLRHVSPMEGLFVVRVVEMRAGFFWIVDDSKKSEERQSIQVQVDVDDRLTAMGRRQAKMAKRKLGIEPRKSSPRFFEENLIRYFQLALGEEAGLKYFEENIPEAAPATNAEDVYKKCGTESLHVGSHVRLWMTDVYAIGTITMKDINGLSKNHFEITWIREDWEPEILELFDEDECLDEDNDNRWQKLWFPYWEE